MYIYITPFINQVKAVNYFHLKKQLQKEIISLKFTQPLIWDVSNLTRKLIS